MADSNVKIRVALEGISAVTSGLQSIGSAALKIGTVLAGAAGLGALGAAAVNVAKLGGELSDLSAKTGIGARSLIVLRQAFNDAGVGADAVGSSVNKLQRTIVEAAAAGGAASDALTDIGLSARDLSALAPEDQFRRVSEAISSIQDPAQRTAAAMAIFGKSGGDLLPLFADGGAIENAERVLGKMPEVLGRSVPVLDNISDAFDRLPLKATQLFAGILDQIGPTVQAMLDAFESIDLTSIGQKIGAFVQVAINEFRAGRFSEFIGDVIEAGFEIGMESGARLFKRFTDWIGSGDMWATLANGLVTAINGAMKTVAGLFLDLATPLTTLSDFSQDIMIWAFKSAVNFLAESLEKVLNAAAVFINEKFGTDLGTISLGRADSQTPDISRNFQENRSAADEAKQYINEFFDASTSAFRQLTGVSPFAAGTGARERVAGRVNEAMASVDARNAPIEGPMQQTAPPPAVVNTRLELQRLELGLAQRLEAINAQKGAVESSWLMTTNQKREERKRLLIEERNAINEQVIALEALRDTASENDRIAIDQKVTGLQGRSDGLGNQITGLGPDPNSFGEQFSATLINLQSQFLTVSQSMAQAFADAFNAATSSISNGIQGLIYGTMTWGQALMSIGQSIGQSLIKSFSDMVAQWIMSHVIMKGVSTAWSAFQSSLRAKDVAEANATEAAKMPALAANATLASVGSFGVAAIVGVAAIAGILAAIGAFRDGGYTGDGDRDQVAGIVHRGEYVVPAHAVDRVGIGALEAIASGASPATVVTSPAGPSPITLNMGVFDDPRRMSDWAQSQDGRAVLVDIYRQHAHEFSRA